MKALKGIQNYDDLGTLEQDSPDIVKKNCFCFVGSPRQNWLGIKMGA